MPHPKCYYCICTACSGRRCPWSHLIYKHCNYCQEYQYNRPRLDCDFFEHRMKIRRFKFRRVRRHDRQGTFVLYHSHGTMLGSYDNLLVYKRKLGGYIRPYNIIDKKGYK